jgi:hypothetical protein
MKADNRLAVFCLVALALLVLGLTIENYWNCRIIELRSMKHCEPHFVGKWGGAGYLPVQIFPPNDASQK